MVTNVGIAHTESAGSDAEKDELVTALADCVRELKLARGSSHLSDDLHPASELLKRCRRLIGSRESSVLSSPFARQVGAAEGLCY
jgi:hypothetical protein